MKRITIIGGGASGTLLAINLLLRAGDGRVEINVVEKRDNVGRGVAFGTDHLVHLLNVPAGKMSGLADDPEHFHRWLGENGYNYKGTDFVPRKFFSNYLRDTLEAAVQNSSADTTLNIFDSEAIDIRFSEDKSEVELADGTILYSEAVVLAFGNFLPPHPNVPDLAFTNASKYFRDPWSPEVEERLDPDDAVLIIGTGLSMADAVMQLNERKHRGKITAISTRGLLPSVHRLGFTYPSFVEEIRHVPEVTKVLTIVRSHIEKADADSSDWRAVIDSLRPHTQELWLRLPLAEKKYFMQHLSRYWNVARHRMPPETYAVIDEMRNAGLLEILKGRLRSIEHDGRFKVDYSEIHDLHTIEVDAIINCIVSENNFAKIESPLVQNLLAKGAIRCDALNIGLDAAPDGNLIEANGRPSRNLYTLGTALKGVLWESTAIPEIRVQARDLADKLLRS
jgi:uncharacterized NAD(P)/FAD-binding protein YdhS